MPRMLLIKIALWLCVTTAFGAQTSGATATAQSNTEAALTIKCQTIEVFVAEWPGASVVVFHQRDKADGPKLGELLKKYSGQEIEFETADGKTHRATVERLKSCFGRGLLVFASDEANLGMKEDFVLHFVNHK